MKNEKTTKQVGLFGEQAVIKYIKECGYKLFCQNFYSKYGEIDIIAQREGIIVFIEVKTRAENPLYPPCLSVTKSKQRKIIKTAYEYLIQKNIELQPRFDVAEVIVDKLHENVISINYIENAFSLEEEYGAF